MLYATKWSRTLWLLSKSMSPNFGLAQTSEPPGHKPLAVNVVVVDLFEEEEKGDRYTQRRSQGGG